MNLKKARYVIKFCGAICGHMDCKKARGFIEGHTAATKAAEPLLDLIEKYIKALEQIADECPMKDDPGSMCCTCSLEYSHTWAKEALSSSSHVVAEYRKNILGEEPTAKGREGV